LRRIRLSPGVRTREAYNQGFQASKPVKLHAEANSFPLCDSKPDVRHRARVSVTRGTS
jgi:hypothetical protein